MKRMRHIKEHKIRIIRSADQAKQLKEIEVNRFLFIAPEGAGADSLHVLIRG